jgi:MscS family membrane protein
MADELVVTGRFSKMVDITETLLVYLALSWIFWLLVRTIIEVITANLDSSEADLDSNMLRLIGHILGAIGVVVILAIGAHRIGLPVMSIIAGLGLGGLAVALAIRPTLENLIGGFALYLDKPIRVGDFCAFDDQIGTVEAIGIRSTQVRALDRTLITIPNAQFADTRLINWARADQMLINETIGLRYETDADQLRFVLAKIREMYHGHPRIDDETVRVRFSGYGACSLDISIRVYAKTREWNDYYAIKEDVLLRIKDIVEQAGTGFAFPSQTVYLGRDDGLATDLGEKARSEVAAWRRAGRLPFPIFAADKLEAIKDKLAYPPQGSPDFDTGEETTREVREQLSAEPASEELREPETNKPGKNQ